MRQEQDDVAFRVLARGEGAHVAQDESALHDYFNLGTSLAKLSLQWAQGDARFRKICPYYPGAPQTLSPCATCGATGFWSAPWHKKALFMIAIHCATCQTGPCEGLLPVRVGAGARVLRQDPVECLFQFVCSSNNHISRIHGMVERLCRAYGTHLPVVASAADAAAALPEVGPCESVASGCFCCCSWYPVGQSLCMAVV